MAHRTSGALFALLVLAAPASASTPVSTYVYPSKIEYFPDQKSATSAVIHGAFFFYNKSGGYDAPSCGYMYFLCKPGEEAMCRLQWNELGAAIGGPTCQGFGQLQMLSGATLRSEGTPLANPDPWDLGMGIQAGSFVGGQCAPAMKLKCGGCSLGGRATAPMALFGLIALLALAARRRR